MRVSIVGTGYVGLVTGACLAAIGHRVVCVDRVPERVVAISRGEAPFHEPGLDALLADLVRAGTLAATTDLAEAVAGSELSLIAVGTPDRDGRIDLSQVETAARDIGRVLATMASYHVVTVKSTVVPGTTDGVVRRALEEASGRTAGRDFGLCMNPEFLREGSAVADFMEPDRIVVGQWDERSGAVLADLYARFDCPRLHVGLRNAEFIKYASNLLLATLVSYTNEIAALCEATPGADVGPVMDGVHLDRRLSPVVDGRRVSPGILSYLRPSSGYGGSCLPKDINALRDYARGIGVTTELLDAGVAVNRARPDHLIALAGRAAGPLAGRPVAVLGLAFKAGTDDLRDSPALGVVDRLLAAGARVRAYDPLAMAGARRIYGDRVVFAESAEAALAGAEAAIIATGWPEFAALDWATLTGSMAQPVVVDGRDALRSVALPDTIRYFTIGRHYA